MKKDHIVFLTGNDNFFGQSRRPWVSMNVDRMQEILQKNVTYNSSRRLKQQMLNVIRYTEETKRAENMQERELKQMQKRSKFENYMKYCECWEW